MKLRLSLMSDLLNVCGVCAIVLGLFLASGLANADEVLNPKKKVDDCDVGKTACVAGPVACPLPATCPAAGDVFPECNCK